MSYEPIVFALVLLLIFWGVNRKPKERYTQWKIVLLALVIYLTFIYLYLDLYVVQSKLGTLLEGYREAFVQTEAYREYMAAIQDFLSSTAVSTESIQGHQEKLLLVNELLLFALLGVFAFLAIKTIIILLGIVRSYFFGPRKKLNAFSSLFYEKVDGEIYLKNIYVVPGIVARYFGALFFFVLFIIPLAGYIAYDDLFLEFFQPPLLLLSAMLLMEVGFFLGGEAREKRYGTIYREEDDIDTITQLDLLYERYRQALGKKILSGTAVKNLSSRSFVSSQIPTFDIDYFNHAAKAMQRAGEKINTDYLVGIDTLFSWKKQGKKPNVLFSNAYDEQFEPYLNLFFEFSYLSNKKVIIPTLTVDEKERTIQWIKECIRENVFNVSDCDFFEYEEKRHHILVDTLDALMHDSTLEKYMSDFHFIVLFDLKNFIRRNHLYLNTFLKLYQAITGKSPQILGFSNIPNELEPSFNLIFIGANDDTMEIKIKKEQEEAFYLLVFDSNGKRVQDYLGLDKGFYLGREMPLAYFAYTETGIAPIVVSSDSSSLEEELEDLCRGIDCSVQFKESIKQINNRYFNHIQDSNKLFVVDDNCNLAQTIQKWKNYTPSTEVFLVIVSAPYLLRDYFTSNLSVLIDDSEFYTELLPKGGLSKREKAFMLLLSLSLNELRRDEINLEEVSRESIANFISDNVQDVELHQSDIHVSLRREFNGNSYQEYIYYSISQRNYSPRIHYYTFETTQQEMLGMCLEDDIYHKYNKGMLITLSSRVYRIEDFNHRRRVITVEFIPTVPIPYYRIEKMINIDSIYSEEEILFNKEKNGIGLQVSYRNTDFTCLFSEYCEIGNDVKTILEEKPKRQYHKKRSLLLRFSQEKKFTDAFRNAFIYLLSEVLKVYFPTHYHLVGLKEIEASSDDSNVFEFRILEMSKINYHLLSTIIEGKYFQKILMLMEDVILWSRESNRLLAYGTQHTEPSDMDFDNLQEFLSQYLLQNNEITANRYAKRKFLVKKAGSSVDNSIKKHYCDFCGAPLPAGQYERLSDGRERCAACSRETAAKKKIAPVAMLREAMGFLEQKYDISIDQNIDIEILSSKKLHQKIGEEQIISDGFDARAVGIAVKRNEKKTILIENEAPYFREMGVLVHELTHIWQYDNLNIEAIPDRIKILEGHAMYVELEFIKERFGEKRDYIQGASARNDIYGKGYREILELVGRNRSNIFTILEEKYGL